MAQIINYWHYPSTVQFDSDDSYTSDGSAGNIVVDDDSIEYSFPSFSELNSKLSVINYDRDEEEEAYLCFAAGIAVEMNYGDQSSAYTRKVASALTNKFSFGSARTVWGSSSAWSQRKDKVIENIKKGWPVQIAVSNDDGGHSVVIDGYRTDDYFHVNVGWSDSGTDTWYNLPTLDTTLHDRSWYSDIIHTVVYDICPYQGWNQYGADEKSSFCTPYAAPQENKSKWQRECSSGYFFNGLVVGTGNKIYASCSPRYSGRSDHPSIWVINQ